MKHQEAEALVAKMSRIWFATAGDISKGFSVRWGVIPTPHGLEFEFHFHVYSVFQMEYKGGDISISTQRVRSISKRTRRVVQTGSLRYSAWNHEIRSGKAVEGLHQNQADFDLFANEWLPAFRRNCYLMGAAIECTATEKIEWQLLLQEQPISL